MIPCVPFVLDFEISDEWKPLDELKFRSFKLITQNSYHGGKVPKPQLDPEGIPTCSCLPNDGGCHEDSFCTNRILYMECVPMCCPSLIPGGTKYCSNTVIQRRAFPATEVFRSRSCGYGLRMLENVQSGRVIIEYLGQVVTCDEGKRRMATYRDCDDFYFMSLGNGLMLDAKSMGSNARFVNHSCDPNCVLQKWNVLGETRLVIVATKSIVVGEEISYNYNYYDDDLGDIPRQVCMCGADNCSKTIGGRKVDSAEMTWIEKANVILNGGRRYTVEVAEQHLHSWNSIKQNRQNKTRNNLKNWDEKKIRNGYSKHPYSDEISESIDFNVISSMTETLEPSEYRKLYSAVESAKAWKVKVNAYLNREKEKTTRTIKAKVLNSLLTNAPVCLKLEEYIEIERRLKSCDKMERLWNTRLGTQVSNDYSSNFTFDIHRRNDELNGVKLSFKEKKHTVPLSSIQAQPQTEHVKVTEGCIENIFDAKVLQQNSYQQEKNKCNKNFSSMEMSPVLQPKIPMRYTWNEWVADIKDLRGFAPVYCSVAPHIFNIYQEACVWTVKNLSPYFYHDCLNMKKALNSDNRSGTGGNLGYWTRTLWPILQDLGSMYKIPLQPDF